MGAWYASPYTGLFRRSGPIAPRPHDPAVAVWSGELPPWGPRAAGLVAGGAGWDAAAAEAACVGEAVERVQAFPFADDQAIHASFARWPRDEPAVAPRAWVLFHPEQYAEAGFPFTPFTEEAACRWVCCREAVTGWPRWVPEEFVYLEVRPGDRHHFAPAVSTGLSCGRVGQPVLLRGLQEVIERDAVVGAWWGGYPLEEWPAEEVFRRLGESVARRVQRPNLRYRFYRVETPFSAHVTIVTVEGQDREGFCFSAGSACRATRRASWEKALLEAIHGRHYVRYLLATPADRPQRPRGFAEHAVYYSLHPNERARTVLERASSPRVQDAEPSEGLAELAERLGRDRPVLFRCLTPPGLAQAAPEWYVLRVLVPGLQPLHGDHHLPHLGGPLWSPRGLAEWERMPPHPFP